MQGLGKEFAIFSYASRRDTPPLENFVGDSESNREEWRRESAVAEAESKSGKDTFPQTCSPVFCCVVTLGDTPPFVKFYLVFDAQPVPLN